MEFKNAVYNRFGTFDCEIKHPADGWIPYTANPDDPDKFGRDLYAAILEGGDIGPVPAEQIELHKLQKKINAAVLADQFINQRSGVYPAFERLTFQIQEAEARSFAADPTASAPMLEGIAIKRGISVSDQVMRVIQKADNYKFLASSVAGQRQHIEDLLDSAQTIDEINAVEILFTYP